MRKLLAENLLQADLAVFQLIFGCNGRRFTDLVFRAITHSGGVRAYIAIGGGVLLFSLGREKLLLYAALIAFAIEISAHKLLKIAFRRARPFATLEGISSLVNPPDQYSFPSGHTAAAFVTAAILCVADPFLGGPAFIWASLIGVSRIYLGVHYPTDVLAGLLLGLFSAHCGLSIVF